VVPGVTYHYTDQGTQTTRYRLLPHEGGWSTAHPDRAAFELQEPLVGRPAAPQEGDWRKGSLLQVTPDNVVLSVAKWTEDGRDLVVRGYEAEGRPGHVVVTSEVLDLRWEGDVQAHEIWTWRLPLDGGAAIATNLLEEQD